MKRSKEFENILSDCLERLLVSGQTVEQCLERYPEHSGELRPILETARQINSVSAIQPRPEFREQARQQFRAALREKSFKPSRSLFNWGWQPRWATAMVSVILALILAGGGTVAAANDSMPDELLYPVKLATEQVRLTLTPSDLGKAELYAELTDRRIAEITEMVNEGKPEEIEQTARLLETYLNKVVDLSSGRQLTVTMTVTPTPVESAVSEAARAPQEAPLPTPTLSVVSEEPEMAQKSAVAPKAAVTVVEEDEKGQPKVEKAPRALPAADKPVMLARGGGDLDEEDEEEHDEDDRDEEDEKDDDESENRERIKLKEKIEQRALDNIARLRALLATAPPSARPALLQAIALSEASYQRAIESLANGS